MDKNDIIEYVMHTPHNTNRAVLSSMLNQLAEDGGGGGSSDFSTAEVTIVNTGTFGDVFGSMPNCHEAGELGPVAPALIESVFDVESETTGVFVVPIYKNGMANATFDDAVTIVSVTGNAMWDEGEHDVFIAGDCTITAQRPL